MTKIYTLHKRTLGVPCTPGKWVGNPEYAAYLEILMTCGGGMGGKSWYEYVKETKTDLSELNGIIYLTNIDGKEIALNTRYIVKAELVRVMTVHYETTNTSCPPHITERWIVDGDVHLNDKFDPRTDITRGQ